mmetsp:Transcript_70197/g.192658  ORF Transcript_70197/g.192658 Transcript_70197/m.192658 type:complete len:239 (-) Transcript_70197:793-1509(-)
MRCGVRAIPKVAPGRALTAWAGGGAGGGARGGARGGAGGGRWRWQHAARLCKRQLAGLPGKAEHSRTVLRWQRRRQRHERAWRRRPCGHKRRGCRPAIVVGLAPEWRRRPRSCRPRRRQHVRWQHVGLAVAVGGEGVAVAGGRRVRAPLVRHARPVEPWPPFGVEWRLARCGRSRRQPVQTRALHNPSAEPPAGRRARRSVRCASRRRAVEALAAALMPRRERPIAATRGASATTLTR